MQVRERNTVNLWECWKIAKRRKYHALVPLLFFVLGMFGYTKLSSKLYQSSTLILVRNGQLASQSLERVIPNAMSSQGQRIGALRQLVLSYDNIRMVIDSLKLDQRPEIQMAVSEALQGYSYLQQEDVIQMWLIDFIKRSVRVDQEGREFLRITATSTDPLLAYQLAKTITGIFISGTLRSELGGIQGAVRFSEEQLEFYKRKLRESEERLKDFKRKMVDMQIRNQVLISGNIDQITYMLKTTEFELEKAKKNLAELNKQVKRSGLPFSFAQDQGLRQLETKLGEYIDLLQRQLIQYSWRDPRVMKLNDEINRVRADIQERIQEIVESLELQKPKYKELLIQQQTALMDMRFLERKRKVLQNLVTRYQQILNQQPETEITLARLEQEVQANREMYNLLLRQSQGSRIKEALQRTEASFRFQIVEPAQKPLNPVKPDKRLLLTMAILLGLVVGLGAVFLAEYNDNTIKEIEEAAEFSSAPVLGVIPRFSAFEGSLSRIGKVAASLLVIAAIGTVGFIAARYVLQIF